MFLSFFEVPLVLITIGILHDSLAVVFSLLQGASVCGVAFLHVCPFPMEFSIEPLTFIFVSDSVLYLTVSAFDVVPPFTTIYAVGCFLHAFTTTEAFSELTIVHALFDIGRLSFRRVFLSFHYHLHSFAVLEVILELSDVCDVLIGPQLTRSVVFPLEETALVYETALLGTTRQDTLAMHHTIHDLSVIIRLSGFTEDVHVFLSACMW